MIDIAIATKNREKFPKKDVKIDKNKLPKWSSRKPQLHQQVKNYFIIRKEDGIKKESILNKKYHQTMEGMGKIIRLINPKIYIKLKNPKDKIESKLK